jgi:hypothetical protein
MRRAWGLALLVLALLCGREIAAAPLPRDATQDQENQWQRQLVSHFLVELGTASGDERIYWRPPSGRHERIDRARLARFLAGCRQASSGQTVHIGSRPGQLRERGVGIWMAFICTGPDVPAPVLAIDFGFNREGLRRVDVSTDTDLRAYCPGTPPNCSATATDLPIAPPATRS